MENKNIMKKINSTIKNKNNSLRKKNNRIMKKKNAYIKKLNFISLRRSKRMTKGISSDRLLFLASPDRNAEPKS